MQEDQTMSRRTDAVSLSKNCDRNDISSRVRIEGRTMIKERISYLQVFATLRRWQRRAKLIDERTRRNSRLECCRYPRRYPLPYPSLQAALVRSENKTNNRMVRTERMRSAKEQRKRRRTIPRYSPLRRRQTADGRYEKLGRKQ